MSLVQVIFIVVEGVGALTHELFEFVAIQQCIDKEISTRTLCSCVWK